MGIRQKRQIINHAKLTSYTAFKPVSMQLTCQMYNLRTLVLYQAMFLLSLDIDTNYSFSLSSLLVSNYVWFISM